VIQSDVNYWRLGFYKHCQKRLNDRYGHDLNTIIWLKLNNAYWTRNYEHIIDGNKDGRLVIFELSTIRYFGVFNTKYNVFSTFLDWKYGKWGNSSRWKNGKLIAY